MTDQLEERIEPGPDAELTAAPPAEADAQAMEEEAVEAGPLADPLAELQAEVERLASEAAAHLDGWQRERAEFANFRRRREAERNQLAFLTGVRIIEQLLPVIDDFDRALTNLPDDPQDGGWIDGVRLTRRKLVGILESEGVSVIPVSPGDAFDPTIHDAVTHEESEQFSEGQIIAELRAGYRIGERVLRPSLVRVAR